MSRRLGLFAAVSAGALVLAIVTTSGAQDNDPGERIMNAACQECHNVRVIQTQAMDGDGWNKRVSQEIEKGAKVSKEDVPTLVNYLVRTHGPLPDGPGKESFSTPVRSATTSSASRRTAALPRSGKRRSSRC